MLKMLPANASTEERIHFVTHSPELVFLDSNIHDDARQGIATLSEMEAKSTIMQSMLSELRILFGLNVAVSVIVRISGCVFQCVFCTAVTVNSGAVLRNFPSNCRQCSPAGLVTPIERAIVTLKFSFLQARLSRIFLSTIPLEAISKVQRRVVCPLL
jgi:hypothetical protein